MKVTQLQIPIDKRLYQKLELLTQRIKIKKDILMLVDGAEGEGKSTIAVGCMAVLAQLLGRKFTVDNIFFNLDEMIKFATTNEEQMILWDEAALGGLRREWNSKFQIKLLKLLMIARKKKHVYFFNIPRLKRLAEDIIDRAVGLIHVYSRDEITIGTYVYYRKQSMRLLYEAWQTTKKVHYNRFYDFNGRFSDFIERHKLIDAVQYDKKKDAAILQLGEDKEKDNKALLKIKAELKMVKKMVTKIPMEKKELASHLGIHPNTLYGWARYDLQPQEEHNNNIVLKMET